MEDKKALTVFRSNIVALIKEANTNVIDGILDKTLNGLRVFESNVDESDDV